jgi:hypothetical protein
VSALTTALTEDILRNQAFAAARLF